MRQGQDIPIFQVLSSFSFEVNNIFFKRCLIRMDPW